MDSECLLQRPKLSIVFVPKTSPTTLWPSCLWWRASWMSLSSAKQLLAFQKVGPEHSELSCKLWIYCRHQYYFDLFCISCESWFVVLCGRMCAYTFWAQSASRSDQIATQDLPLPDVPNVSDVSLRLLKESPKSLNVRRTWPHTSCSTAWLVISGLVTDGHAFLEGFTILYKSNRTDWMIFLGFFVTYF